MIQIPKLCQSKIHSVEIMEIYSNKKISRETNFSNTELKIGNFSARWILREIDVCQFSVLKNCHFEKYYTSEL